MDGWLDEGPTDGWMAEWMDEGPTYRWMKGLMVGLMDE
jgi:hypothetical protein